MVPSDFDRVHAAMPHGGAHFDARPGTALPGQVFVQPADELARDRYAHGCHVSVVCVPYLLRSLSTLDHLVFFVTASEQNWME